MDHYLDISDWSRRELFEFFIGYSDPYFNVCASVDVTKLVALVRKRPGVKISQAIHYFALRIANEIEPFRYRLKDKNVFVYDVINGGTTVLLPNESFAYVYFDYQRDFEAFITEQEVARDFSVYFDFTHSKGVHLTRFLNFARTGLFPTLGDVFVTSAVGKSLYNGFTAGARKRMSRHYQFEVNYVLSKDKDDDSNERDPFTDRSFDINNLSLDYALSDRDIRHKLNFYMYSELPWGFQFVPRVQARSAQPITPAVRTATNRNTLRKDNADFSFDWRLARPFKFGERYQLIPTLEMFNTFNNANNINPLSTPGLFNFDGFLRQGVGDPRQVQLAIKFTF